MGYFSYIVLFISLLINVGLQAQPNRFSVKLAPFSSPIYDEFSPVLYKAGIVFCSNQRGNSLIGYTDGQNRLFKIYCVTKKDSVEWNRPRLLAREITTDFNDGPVTFSENGNTIYFSRNNEIGKALRNVADPSNKLGIYSAELVNGVWINIKPFSHNNLLYTFSTPALTPDGERIYFASDMPGGSGGMDLYYCNKLNDGWDLPVNLGPVVNTPSNESFPFACRYGKLFFASEGHNGFGGKDLFYTQEVNGEWIVPVHLDSTINSTADDFGLVADSTFVNGYFSSNRFQTDDIFSFSAAPMEFTNCDSLKENNYCFTFSDEQNQRLDTISVIYQWDFGEGIIRIGEEVKHCFPGSGKYSVKLSIVDSLTGNAITEQVEYAVDLEDEEQAYISSYNVGVAGKPISFEGITTNLKGPRITDYFWNFGDGYKTGGPIMNRTFKNAGEYLVQMGILAEADSLGRISKTCVRKTIKIYDALHELELKGNAINERVDSVIDQNKSMQIKVYLMDDLSRHQRLKISEALNEVGQFVLTADQYGIIPASYPFLDRVIQVLKHNPDIRIEVVAHAFSHEIKGNTIQPSERWAQELAFYFKNKGIGLDQCRSKGLGIAHSGIEPFPPASNPTGGVVEFIFMNN